MFSITTVRAYRTCTPHKVASTELDLVCVVCPHQRSAHAPNLGKYQLCVCVDPHVFTFVKEMKREKVRKRKKKKGEKEERKK